MRTDLIDKLVCAACGATDWRLESYSGTDVQVVEGRLECNGCATWFRIAQGIVDLLPLRLRNTARYTDFARQHRIAYEPRSATGLAGDHDKLHQMEFYAGDVDVYEEQLVNTGFWRALDGITFVDWMQRILEPGQRALEIGCGSGRICLRLGEYGVQTIGVDISEEMLQRARQKMERADITDRVDLIVGDGEAPPVRDGIFDACVLHGMLHHVPHPQDAVLSAARKLHPGGLMYTFDPHKSPVRPIFDWLMKIWKLYNEEARDEPLFRESQLRTWFSSAGLDAHIKLTTYLPPHLLYLFGEPINRTLLQISDAVLGRIPGVRKLAGVIVGEGEKIA